MHSGCKAFGHCRLRNSLPLPSTLFNSHNRVLRVSLRFPPRLWKLVTKHGNVNFASCMAVSVSDKTQNKPPGCQSMYLKSNIYIQTSSMLFIVLTQYCEFSFMPFRFSSIHQTTVKLIYWTPWFNQVQSHYQDALQTGRKW